MWFWHLFDHTKKVGTSLWESTGFWVKNLFFFATAIVSTISLYDDQIITKPTAVNWVTAYTLFDTVLYRLNWDVSLHHAIVLSVSSYNFIYGSQWDPYYADMMFKIFLYTEVSSVWLGVRTIFDRLLIEGKEGTKISKPVTIASTMIQLLFALSFYAVRIDYYTRNFILNHDLIDYVGKICWTHQSYPMESIICYAWVMVPMMSLYGLNMYWFNLMIKTIVKAMGLKEVIGKTSRAHYENILTYTLLVTSIGVSYTYISPSDTFKERYYYDMIGTFALGIASFIYHRHYAQYYEEGEIYYIEYDFDQVVRQHKMVTILDQLMIHLRMLLILSSNYGFESIIARVSMYIHLVMFGGLFYKVWRIEEEERYYEKKYPIESDLTSMNYHRRINDTIIIPEMMRVISIFSGITFVVDNLLTCFGNIETFNTFWPQVNFILFILIALGFIIRPFYEANQIYIHVLLILQSFALVYINMSTT